MIYLFIPAIFSLILGLYQFSKTGSDSLWTIIYTLFVAFWTTYMIERWKRKEHHIAYKWGAIKSGQKED